MTSNLSSGGNTVFKIAYLVYFYKLRFSGSFIYGNHYISPYTCFWKIVFKPYFATSGFKCANSIK